MHVLECRINCTRTRSTCILCLAVLHDRRLILLVTADINNRPTIAVKMEEGSEQEELVEQYSFSPRINEHKPVEMRKLAQREAMEAAARDLLCHHDGEEKDLK